MDASQGVEAQTMANVYLALENNLEIITCVNKIDLPNADAEKVMLEVESTIGLDTSNSIKCSAKTGDKTFFILLEHNTTSTRVSINDGQSTNFINHV